MKKNPKKSDPNKVTEAACKRCLTLARAGKIRYETVMFLPEGSWAPEAQDGSGPCCYDCASADGLMRFSSGCATFEMARIVVGNDRQRYFRLPIEMHKSYGLAVSGLVRVLDIDLESQHAWLNRNVPGWDNDMKDCP